MHEEAAPITLDRWFGTAYASCELKPDSDTQIGRIFLVKTGSGAEHWFARVNMTAGYVDYCTVSNLLDEYGATMLVRPF